MKIALVFPGYGSQFVGMGKELYDEYRIVQEYFEEASHCLNTNFVKLCFASSDNELSKLVHAYTSLFLVSCSTYAILKELSIVPDIVAGYNNGEYAALFAAQCFSFPDGLYLLNKFCSFYQMYLEQNFVGALHIHGIITDELEALCNQVSNEESKVFIALYNNPMDHIVAGHVKALEELQTKLDLSIKTKYITPEIGLHSELMNDVVQMFKSYLEKVDFKDLQIPFLSSIDGMIVTNGEEIKKRFIEHIYKPLQFSIIVSALKEYDYIIVVPPGSETTVMLQTIYPEKMIVSIAKKSDIDKLKEIISKTKEEKPQD